jgi:hypothetical protein
MSNKLVNHVMQILETGSLEGWKIAKKVKGLKAKLIGTLIDRSIMDKVLINTLEGPQEPNEANLLCVGEAGDVWQQTNAALHKKYHIINVDGNGWYICEPKPENEVEFIELTVEFLQSVPQFDDMYIKGQWGTTINGNENLQSFSIGDFLCRQTHDHTDQWIVRRNLFKNTYTEM